MDDENQIRKLRRQAIEESARIVEDAPEGGFKGLVDDWFAMQADLPATDGSKRASTTIAENRREADSLVKAWGHFEVSEITAKMGLDYLKACKKSRPHKGNKEISLGRLIMQHAIGLGLIETNPLNDLERNKTVPVKKRYVTDAEMALAVEMGRKFGGARLIVALALKTAWLCVRRSFEVRQIQREAVTPAGIIWTDSKSKTKPTILIEWSPELSATIYEAMEVKRNKDAGTLYLFGNLRGEPYTKGGWKAMLDDLMRECVKEAAKRGIPFRKFSLQDCRPKGATDKQQRGDTDTKDALLHSSDAMLARHYDRRDSKKATPAG
ncbi:hypothetical protein [Variovorax ginsengisoli]|uniref:Integrase n=1 Tax=Variovorax ginsengisoli TaxID=363844 RepID=A0ABT8SDW7_9BURK|nr:hypothetical protein [Variovorax ginsengisoli]MDN8617805.1 hypothetical protein [Variovorax ginsengisoli]MDO1536975.1 hypothetical protein [Variovorax ginsengisoli]